MKSKKLSRLKRAKRARAKIAGSGRNKLTVHRTPKHIYAQLISNDSSEIIVSASTLDKELSENSGKTGNVEAAKRVGKLIAERAKEKGQTLVAFDRSGFKYHGRVKALADAAKEHGMEF